MAAEIERKYLVNTALWHPVDAGVLYRQGYLSSVKERVVRVRIAGEEGFLTIKGLTTGIRRSEFEYPIPLGDAAAMLDGLCEKPLIEKYRHRATHGGKLWEIDVFHGENEGLIVAECELRSTEERVAPPALAGEEVSSRRLALTLLQQQPDRTSLQILDEHPCLIRSHRREQRGARIS